MKELRFWLWQFDSRAHTFIYSLYFSNCWPLSKQRAKEPGPIPHTVLRGLTQGLLKDRGYSKISVGLRIGSLNSKPHSTSTYPLCDFEQITSPLTLSLNLMCNMGWQRLVKNNAWLMGLWWASNEMMLVEHWANSKHDGQFWMLWHQPQAPNFLLCRSLSLLAHLLGARTLLSPAASLKELVCRW